MWVNATRTDWRSTSVAIAQRPAFAKQQVTFGRAPRAYDACQVKLLSTDRSIRQDVGESLQHVSQGWIDWGSNDFK